MYNEFVHDRHHTHMSATRWRSLHGFSAHLESSCEDGPNKLGLHWKVDRGQRREYQKQDGGVGEIDEIKIMLIDVRAEEDRLRKETEISGRERDRKYEEKHIQKQIKLAQKFKDKQVDASANADAPSEPKPNIDNQPVKISLDSQPQHQATKPLQKPIFGAKADSDSRLQALMTQEVHNEGQQTKPKSQLDKLLERNKEKAEETKIEEELLSIKNKAWLRAGKPVKIRDQRHRYYGKKCLVHKVDIARDEVVLELKAEKYDGKRIYLQGIKKWAESRLKRVIPRPKES